MVIEINEQKIRSFFKIHIRVVVPSILWFVSYVTAHNAEETFIGVWFGVLAIVSMIFAAISTFSFVHVLYHGLNCKCFE